MRAALVALAIAASTLAQAAPAEDRYDGPRLSFSIPAGTQVKEASDIATDHAVEIVLPKGRAPMTTLRVLISSSRVTDADAEGVALAWRDARLRNRASWGVRVRGDAQVEVNHVGGKRVIRLSDQMGGVLGGSRQLTLCASISARLVCAISNGPLEAERDAEAILGRVLETIVVHKKH